MERKKECTFKRLALVEVQEMFLMNSQGKSMCDPPQLADVEARLGWQGVKASTA